MLYLTYKPVNLSRWFSDFFNFESKLLTYWSVYFFSKFIVVNLKKWVNKSTLLPFRADTVANLM